MIANYYNDKETEIAKLTEVLNSDCDSFYETINDISEDYYNSYYSWAVSEYQLTRHRDIDAFLNDDNVLEEYIEYLKSSLRATFITDINKLYELANRM